MRESWVVQRLVVVVALISSGCLAEYVLPGGSRGDTGLTPEDTVVSADAPTGGAMTGGTGEGDSDDDSEDVGECTVGTSRCGDLCVDWQSDARHCGCDEVCETDEMCLMGECRDVVVLDCSSCPCADQCPAGGDGVLASTTGEEGGGSNFAGTDDTDDTADTADTTDTADTADTADTTDSGGEGPQQGLCCELAEAMQVVCVLADVDETVVCP